MILPTSGSNRYHAEPCGYLAQTPINSGVTSVAQALVVMGQFLRKLFYRRSTGALRCYGPACIWRGACGTTSAGSAAGAGRGR